MTINLMDILTTIVVIFVFYIAICFVDYHTNPADVTPKSYFIHTGEKVSQEMPIIPDVPILLKKGQDITLIMEAHRNKDFILLIERYITEDDREYLNVVTKRVGVTNTVAESSSFYHLPEMLKPGCNHAFYSQYSYYIKNNILTTFFPIIIKSKKIPFCLEE